MVIAIGVRRPSVQFRDFGVIAVRWREEEGGGVEVKKWCTTYRARVSGRGRAPAPATTAQDRDPRGSTGSRTADRGPACPSAPLRSSCCLGRVAVVASTSDRSGLAERSRRLTGPEQDGWTRSGARRGGARKGDLSLAPHRESIPPDFRFCGRCEHVGERSARDQSSNARRRTRGR